MDDDDEFHSDAQSVNSEIDVEFDVNSEDDNNSDLLNDGEDPNSPDDDIDPAVAIQAFKHLQGVFHGCFEKKGKSRHFGVQKLSRKSKGKLTVGASTSNRAGSRFNSKYFGEIIGKLDERKKKIIRDHGFGILLEYDGCSAPRGFVQWLADQVDVNCFDIVVGGKSIPFCPQSVHLFLGIPIGGEDISRQHNDSAKSRFLEKINETSLPLIKTFGDKLEGNTLSDDDVFRYFMVVALSTFLCPNSSTHPSPKYLGALIDVASVKDWDWSKFVFEWLFASISTHRKRRRNTIGGCIYFLAAYYLDFINFGSCNQLSPNLPRILYWKGSMIKRYASYDCVSADKYGKRPVKSIKDTCYAESLLPVESCASFRDSLDTHCNFLHKEDKDDMCDIYQDHHTKYGSRNPARLVGSMFKYMEARDGSVLKFMELRPDRAVHVDPVRENSDARRMPSPAHGIREEGVDAMGQEHEA